VSLADGGLHGGRAACLAEPGIAVKHGPRGTFAFDPRDRVGPVTTALKFTQVTGQQFCAVSEDPESVGTDEAAGGCVCVVFPETDSPKTTNGEIHQDINGNSCRHETAPERCWRMILRLAWPKKNRGG
jgi:hypothetical protein